MVRDLRALHLVRVVLSPQSPLETPEGKESSFNALLPLTNSHILLTQSVLFALWILIFISFLCVIYHHLLCWQTCSQRAGYSFMDSAIFHLEICFWSSDECKFNIYSALRSVWSPPTPLGLVETRPLCLHMLNDAVYYPVVYKASKNVWHAFCVDKNISKTFYKINSERTFLLLLHFFQVEDLSTAPAQIHCYNFYQIIFSIL